MSTKEKLITIVIPYYNASKTIEDTLMSICIQSLKSQVDVVIVDDASKKSEYDKLVSIVKKFKKYIDVDYIHYDENRGPGYARQKGLDMCKHKYVMFMDGDDVLATSTALFVLVNELEKDENCQIISSNFIEEVRNSEGNYVDMHIHVRDMTWMFGKLYRLQYLIDNDISFNDSRANEDSGFNAQCILYAKEGTIKYLDKLTYCWNYNPSSITKNNDYNFNGLKGYIENHTWCIHKVYRHYLETHDNNGSGIISNIVNHALKTFAMIYLYRMELTKNGRSQEQLNIYDNWAMAYYRDTFIYFKFYFNNTTIRDIYFLVSKNHQKMIDNFILPFNIFQYIDYLNNKMLDELDMIQILDADKNLVGYVKKEDKDKIDPNNPNLDIIIKPKDINEHLKIYEK